MRRRLIAGNWKMNGSRAALIELDGIAAAAAAAAQDIDVAICPPFPLIEHAAARAPALPIGGQDCHWDVAGAYTGCISAGMLVEAGATMTIVGHSERRRDQHETDAEVKRKAEAAIAAGLTAIVCVGETGPQRDAGHAEDVVIGQLRGSLPLAGGDRLVVAYEPLWAIGTGKSATRANVEAMHMVIRRELIAILGADRAEAVRLLYGGSVSAANAAELLSVPYVDGGLIGGASLTAEAFVPIIEIAAAA